MKQTYKYLLVAAALLVGACSHDNSEQGDTARNEIALSGDVAETRAPSAAVHFNLMAIKTGSISFGDTFIPQSPAVYGTDNSITTAQRYYWPTNGDMIKFYGFMKASDVSAPTFAPEADGTLVLSAGEGAAYDFLLSNNLSARQNAAANKMVFRHLMTQLKVNITVDNDVTQPVELKATVAAGKTEGTYSMFEETATTAITRGSNYSPELALGVGAVGAASNVIYHLVPDNATTITKLTSVTINDIAADDIDIVVPGGGSAIKLEGGVSYELTINVSRRGVATATVALADWDETTLGNGTGSAGETSSYNYNLVWDNQGAAVTAVELGGGSTTNLFNVEEDAQTPGTGKTVGAISAATPFTTLAVFHNNTRVDLGTSGALWTYDDPSKTITVNAVLVAESAHLTAIDDSDATRAKSYFQVADIDLGSNAWEPIGDFVYFPRATTPFTGLYDGLNFNIHNLNIDGSAIDHCTAMFKCSTGTIRNLRVASGSVSGKQYVAAICGKLEAGGVIENCYNAAEVSSSMRIQGGIVGHSSGDVLGCENAGKVYALANGGSMGGIVGEGDATSTIKNCINRGKVSGNPTMYSAQVGGICGLFLNPAVDAFTECVNYGEVTSEAGTILGGIVGINRGYLSKSENRGVVLAGSNAGGIAGQNYVTITECKNHVDINGAGAQAFNGYTIGGIAGSNMGGFISHSINYGSMKAEDTVGGIVGSMGDDINANPVTYARVERCENYGDVTTSNAGYRAGGVIGQNSGSGSLILGCLNAAAVESGYYLGGIVGDNQGEIAACANTGNTKGLTTYGYVGGIVGFNSGASASTTACYNTGDIHGYYGAAGIVGYCYNGAGQAHTGSYNLGNVTTTGNVANIDPVLAVMSGNTLTDCYTGGDSPASTKSGVLAFNDAGQWPGASWTALGGHGVSAYWSDLGGWTSGGTPTYPKLYWE